MSKVTLDLSFEQKYLKYKNKYLNIKNKYFQKQIGGKPSFAEEFKPLFDNFVLEWNKKDNNFFVADMMISEIIKNEPNTNWTITLGSLEVVLLGEISRMEKSLSFDSLEKSDREPMMEEVAGRKRLLSLLGL